MKKYDVFVILTEDICTNFNCYGDKNANTPNIDEFAKENIRFSYCSSAAPVCSAARTSLNLGMYASTAGVGQHRSFNDLPKNIKNLGEYMQDEGYFTAIGKTDFNFSSSKGYNANYNSTPKDSPMLAKDLNSIIQGETKPLFVLHTVFCTHQSQYGYTEDTDEHRKSMPRLKESEYIDRNSLTIPDYHFDEKETREIWGQYYEKIATLDRIFGEAIDTLKSTGKYENSIILFAGDNGHGIPSGKCELWNEGVHVPLIIHVPKELESNLELHEDEYGKICDNLVSFIDFAPTIISLSGGKIPEHMQGRPFLGENAVAPRKSLYSFSERVDEVYENSRSIREHDLLYTCDFGYSNYRRLNAYQTNQAPWFVRAMIDRGYADNIEDTDRRMLFRGMPRISEQVFDMINDPSQLKNIAETNKGDTKRMREEMFARIKDMRDGVFMPEPILLDLIRKLDCTPYEILQNDEYYPIDSLIELQRSIFGNNVKSSNIDAKNPCIAIMLIKHYANIGEMENIKVFTSHESETVRAYSHFKLEDEKSLIKLCETTDNLILLMFVMDLVAFWLDEKGKMCLKAFNSRKNDFDTLPERYVPAITNALKMLEIRMK